MRKVVFLITFILLAGCSSKKRYFGATAEDIINTSGKSLDKQYKHIMYQGIKYYIIDDINKDLNKISDGCFKGNIVPSLSVYRHAVINGKFYTFIHHEKLNDGSCGNLQ